MALVAVAVAALLYGLGIRAARRRGTRWPVWSALAFFVLGLGSFAWIELGFLGTWSTALRWAFTARLAFLLFVVPGLVTLGRPLELARAALSDRGVAVLERVLRSWPVRTVGNVLVAPLIAFAGFLLLLTPFAATLRMDPGWEIAITIGMPLLGLLMVLPIADRGVGRAGFAVAAEFLIAFVELALDAIPGILLRINDTVLDHAGPVLGALPDWFPAPLHDQHLAGDLLWFIAEVADLPLLVLLFVRWIRTDRHEARRTDELSDEDYEAAVQAHLRAGGGPGATGGPEGASG